MIITISNEYQLQRRFDDMGRGESFSNEAFRVLFNYLNEVLPEDTELDVVGIDSEFSEYSISELWNDYNDDLLEFAEDNGVTIEDLKDLSTKTELTVNYFDQNTTILPVEHNNQPDTYIVAAF